MGLSRAAAYVMLTRYAKASDVQLLRPLYETPAERRNREAVLAAMHPFDPRRASLRPLPLLPEAARTLRDCARMSRDLLSFLLTIEEAAEVTTTRHADLLRDLDERYGFQPPSPEHAQHRRERLLAEIPRATSDDVPKSRQTRPSAAVDSSTSADSDDQATAAAGGASVWPRTNKRPHVGPLPTEPSATAAPTPVLSSGRLTAAQRRRMEAAARTAILVPSSPAVGPQLQPGASAGSSHPGTPATRTAPPAIVPPRPAPAGAPTWEVTAGEMDTLLRRVTAHGERLLDASSRDNNCVLHAILAQLPDSDVPLIPRGPSWTPAMTALRARIADGLQQRCASSSSHQVAVVAMYHNDANTVSPTAASDLLSAHLAGVRGSAQLTYPDLCELGQLLATAYPGLEVVAHRPGSLQPFPITPESNTAPRTSTIHIVNVWSGWKSGQPAGPLNHFYAVTPQDSPLLDAEPIRALRGPGPDCLPLRLARLPAVAEPEIAATGPTDAAMLVDALGTEAFMLAQALQASHDAR